MTDKNIKNLQIGAEPTEEEKFYVKFGWETLGNNLKFVNEVLRQMVTLNAALLGASIVFLDEKKVGSAFAKFIAICFFVSLVVSFFGILPFEGRVDVRKPLEVQIFNESALKRKRACVWLAALSLALGFGVALGAFISH